MYVLSPLLKIYYFLNIDDTYDELHEQEYKIFEIFRKRGKLVCGIKLTFHIITKEKS